ncbi:MAG: hypothetical protein ACRC6T_09185 [Sarcina sp.]
MELEGINIIQQVSNSIVTYESVLCFKNKIENKSKETIKDLKLINYRSEEFDKHYYEFENSRNAINIVNDKGIITIDELFPGDIVIIYISMLVVKKFKDDKLTSYSQIEFRDSENNKIIVKSDEVEVEFRKDSKISENGFKITIDKKIIDEEDEYNIDIFICNDGTDKIECVEIYNMIPKGTRFIKDTLFINDSFINVGEDINNIRLGDMLPLQSINLTFAVHLDKNQKYSKVLNKAFLRYETVTKIGDVKKQGLVSNSVELDVRKADIGVFAVCSDRNEVICGEEIEYTVVCENTGNVGLYDLEFTQEANLKFKFVEDSCSINDKSEKGLNLYKGIRVDYLDKGEKLIFKYKCVAIGSDLENSENVMNLIYKYNNPDVSKVNERKISCKCKKIKIIEPRIGESVKIIEETSMFVGDTSRINILISNTGNTPLKNIIVSDVINKGLKLIENSIKVNEIRSDMNDISKITIGKIEINEEVNITYEIKAIDISSLYERKTNKDCMVKYEYDVEEKKYSKDFFIESSNIIVSGAIIREEDVIKNMDRTCIGLSEEVLVSLNFLNSGNHAGEGVFVKERQNTTLRFIQGSLTINGVKSDYDIEEGVLIGEINPLESIKLTYRLRAVRIPYTPTLISATTIIYQSIIDGNGKRGSNMLIAQSEKLNVRGANIDFENGLFIREVESSDIEINEFIKFRVLFRNNGNVCAYNVILKEILGENILIKEDSVRVNGICKKYSKNIISIGTLEVDQECEVTYEAKGVKGESRKENTISKIEYEYYISDGEKSISKFGKSNLIEMNIYDAGMGFNDSISKKIVTLNEHFEYSLYLRNKGNVDIYNLNLKFEHEDKHEIDVADYIVGKIKKNETDIQNEVYIGDIKVGQTYLVILKLIIKNSEMIENLRIKPVIKGDYISSDGDVRNIIKTGKGQEIIVNTNKFEVVKRTTRNSYLCGEIVDYLVTIRNEGKRIAENVLIDDEGLNYGIIENSITVNGKIIKEKYIGGIYIDKVEVGECIFLRYSAIYDKSYKNKAVKSRLKVMAKFYNSTTLERDYEYLSDEYVIFLSKVDLKIIKTTSEKSAKYNENIKFITTIQNDGDIDIYDLEFIEENSKGLKSLDKKEIYLNSRLLSKFEEKKLIIRPRDIYEIVTEYKYINYKSVYVINSLSKIKYKYQGFDNIEKLQTKESNIIDVEFESNIFKILNIEHKIYLENVYVDEITEFLVEAIVTDSYIINTIKSKIYSDNILTGKKLMVRGYLDEKIEYISNSANGEIELLKYRETFTASITLPENFSDEQVRIITKINDVKYKLINKEMIFNNINLILDVYV